MDQTKQVIQDNIEISFQAGNYGVDLIHISYEPPRCPWAIEPHSHNTYEIHFIPCGHGTLQHNGKDYCVCENTFYITGPGIIHAQTSTKDNPMSEYCINLDFNYSGENHGFIGGSNDMNQLIRTLIENKFYFGEDTFCGTGICREIFEEIEHPLTGCSTKITLLILKLIIEIARSILHKTNLNSELKKKDINSSRKRILDTIFRDYRGNITSAAVAEQLFITQRQLRRIMQSYYGMSLTQKINALRIDYAKERLVSTKMTIGEIARYAGYTTEQYFCKTFKLMENCTPLQYRKANI